MVTMNSLKPIILIVDDVPDNLDILYEVLKEDYEIAAAKKWSESY